MVLAIRLIVRAGLARSHSLFFAFRDTNTDTLSPCAPKQRTACFGAQVSSKHGTWYSKRVILQFIYVGCWAGVTYLRYTVLKSSNKSETAVHCCDPGISVLVMLVSRNVFHVVSALQSLFLIDNAWKRPSHSIILRKIIVFILGIVWLIRQTPLKGYRDSDWEVQKEKPQYICLQERKTTTNL